MGENQMLKNPIKFDDLLKAVDSLTPEQKQLLRQHIDETDWASRFSKALTGLQADVPTGIPEEEVQTDIEEAIRQVRSKNG